MLKRIWRWLKYRLYFTTLNDLQDDIEHKRFDFTKYLVTIPSGTSMHRLVTKDDDPIAPTGIGEGYPGNSRGHRWVSTPPGFSFEAYRKMYYENDPQIITVSTGAACMSLNMVTPFKEADNAQNKDLYKLTLKKDIQVVDLELICKKLRIPTPLSEERHPVYHLFYRMHIYGVRFKCFKPGSTSDELNIIIYTDWLKELKGIVTVEKIEKEQFLTICPKINNYLI